MSSPSKVQEKYRKTQAILTEALSIEANIDHRIQSRGIVSMMGDDKGEGDCKVYVTLINGEEYALSFGP